MSTIIIAILLVVVGAFLLERGRTQQKKAHDGSTGPTQKTPTANEVGPSETGKMRVAQMLRSTAEDSVKSSNPNPAAKTAPGNSPTPTDDLDTALPDPFSLADSNSTLSTDPSTDND